MMTTWLTLKEKTSPVFALRSPIGTRDGIWPTHIPTLAMSAAYPVIRVFWFGIPKNIVLRIKSVKLINAVYAARIVHGDQIKMGRIK